MRAVVFWLTVALNLLVLNGLIAHKHRLLHGGQSQTIRLKLANYNHSWYLRGNTLGLHFELPRQVSPALSPVPPSQPLVGPPAPAPPPVPRPPLGSSGCLVVALDANQVARFVRVHGGEVLQPGEHLLGYRMKQAWVVVGAESFTFEEGHAQDYISARYAEFRVSPSGESVLVGLLGPNFERLGPSAKTPDK